MSRLFTLGGQSFEASASASDLPMNTLSCVMWALVPCPGIEPGPLALGAPMNWATREVPGIWLTGRPEKTSPMRWHVGFGGASPAEAEVEGRTYGKDRTGLELAGFVGKTVKQRDNGTTWGQKERKGLSHASPWMPRHRVDFIQGGLPHPQTMAGNPHQPFLPSFFNCCFHNTR